LNVPQSAVVIGIPAYPERDNRVANALAIPFRRQRDYWRRPDGTIADRKRTDIEAALTHMEE
jgi:hypothetical protein